jgi:hypothetical protein
MEKDIWPGRGKIRLTMLAADGFGVDFLLAERADTAMGRFPWRDRDLAVLAPDGVHLHFFPAIRTLTRC